MEKANRLNLSHENTQFSFPNDGDRPTVEKYAKDVKFRVNDRVCLRTPGTQEWEGPYTVSSVQDGRYTLCDAALKAIQDNKTFEEQYLKLYNPFG